MKVILGSKKRHYAVGVSIFLITAALLWAMMGCTTPLEEYKLTISSTEGGSVTDPGEGTFFLSKGMSVLLEVQPDDGYRLVGWTGDWDRIKKVGSTLIVIRDDYSITAEFKKIEKCCLTVSAPVGGGVTVTTREVSDPRGEVSTYYSDTYDSGKVLYLLAQENRGFEFVNWTGDVGNVENVNAASTKVEMDGNYSITANFEAVAAVNITDPNLRAAIIEATGITEQVIYPSDLKKLKSLDAGQKDVSDLTGLEYCTGLEQLYIDDNQIGDISPVANLKSLKKLYLSGNRIDDISPVANLTSLRQLYLCSNQIDDISPLANLRGLTHLYLSGNQISDIWPLADLASLTALYLWDNQISDISALTKLTALTRLELGDNGIRNVSPLAGLASLEELSLGGNKINDISRLVNLSHLTFLNLSNNQIGDIKPLIDNPGLSRGAKVYLYSNPLRYRALSSSDPSNYIAQLEERGVIVEY